MLDLGTKLGVYEIPGQNSRRREPFARPIAPYGLRAAVVALLVTGLFLQTLAGQSDEPFEYKGVKYAMQPYSALFGSTVLGQARERLFVEYLKSSAEGRERVKRAGTDNPMNVWATLDAEEKTTFLAVTAAASRLMSEKSGTILSWFERLEQIHGSTTLAGGTYNDNQAFRLYVRLSKDGIAHVAAGNGRFTNTCTNRPVSYGGWGSRHPDFCKTSGNFEKQKPTKNSPRIQINVTPSTGCADVDLDYDYDNDYHLTKDNSNVLAWHPSEDQKDYPAHVELFTAQYCEIGFRRAQP